jgi:hypothetical protein
MEDCRDASVDTRKAPMGSARERAASLSASDSPSSSVTGAPCTIHAMEQEKTVHEDTNGMCASVSQEIGAE